MNLVFRIKSSGGLVLLCYLATSAAFSTISPRRTRTNTRLSQSSFSSQSTTTTDENNIDDSNTLVDVEQLQKQEPFNNPFPGVLSSLQDKIGSVDDARIAFPEYESGQVTRLFSTLQYSQNTTTHATTSVLGASALVAGTTIGAGILALPTATAPAGFVPSTLALISAWIYMTMSGLLVAELSLNRLIETGQPGHGILELYDQKLSRPLATAGKAAYFFLHYAVMVAYVAQGGSNVQDQLQLGNGVGQVAFAAAVAAVLFGANAAVMEQINNAMVVVVFATFAAIVGIGAPSADFGALLDATNQHPEQVVNCLPILFLALVYQNIVPTVVMQLEGDRTKIVQAIVAGTTLPMLMFAAWNAVVLGNVVRLDAAGDLTDPVALLASATGDAGTSALLGPLVTTFSCLAIVTSMVGFTYGLVDAWTDVFKIPTKGADYEKYKLPLFALVFVPPVALSMANPDIFYLALEYGGAFGVSTLFLVLPPIMAWQQRYGSDEPLATKPLVPFGKIPLGSMWKIAATLMLEQTAEKMGVFDFFAEHFGKGELF